MCTPGLGMLSMPYIISWAMGEHGWRWTCTMMGAYVLHIAILATVYFPTDTERQTMLSFDGCWEGLVGKLRRVGCWRSGSQKTSLPVETSRIPKQEVCVGSLIQNEVHGKEDGLIKDNMRKIGEDTDGNSEEIFGGEGGESLTFDVHGVLGNNGSQSVEPHITFKDGEYRRAHSEKGENNCDPESDDINSAKNSVNDKETLSNLSINFSEFISREDRRSFKLTNHVLRLEKEHELQGSLKSLPLTFTDKKGTIQCLSSPRLPSQTKYNKDLKDQQEHAPSTSGITADQETVLVTLNASVEHVQFENSETILHRKRSSSSVSHQSYRSLRMPLHLNHLQASPKSYGSSLVARSRSWIHSQTDVMGSSLLLPIRVEEVKMEPSPENERSVKENLKM